MCGRYVAATPTSVLADFFDIDETAEDAEDDRASFNVAPTDPVPAVAVNKSDQRVLGPMRWGLVPSWSKDAKGGARMINARSETVLDTPAFRSAFSRRRCLIPADGFYEWEHGPDRKKRPWYIHRADGEPMVFAGLWEVWRPPGAGPEDPWLRTCSILTTRANTMMAAIHDRMPVLLDRDDWQEWLDRSTTAGEALFPLLVPAEDDVLVRHRVSTEVNSVRHNAAELIEPVTDDEPPPVPLKLL